MTLPARRLERQRQEHEVSCLQRVSEKARARIKNKGVDDGHRCTFACASPLFQTLTDSIHTEEEDKKHHTDEAVNRSMVDYVDFW